MEQVCDYCGESVPQAEPGAAWVCPFCGGKNEPARTAAAESAGPAGIGRPGRRPKDGRRYAGITAGRVAALLVLLTLCAVYLLREPAALAQFPENMSRFAAAYLDPARLGENLSALGGAGPENGGFLSNFGAFWGMALENLSEYIEEAIAIWSRS